MKRIYTRLIFLVLVGMLAGCSPHSGYKVLSFFFDGVPSGSKKQNGSIHEAGNQPHSQALRASARSVKASPALYNHPPFFDKQCTKCHSTATSSTLAKPMPGLCYSCHKDFKTRFAYVHGPVAGGFCNACHAAHRADNTQLLKRQGQALCLYCHAKEQVMPVKAHAGIGDTDCMKCHDPHGGANHYVLK